MFPQPGALSLQAFSWLVPTLPSGGYPNTAPSERSSLTSLHDETVPTPFILHFVTVNTDLIVLFDDLKNVTSFI